MKTVANTAKTAVILNVDDNIKTAMLSFFKDNCRDVSNYTIKMNNM